MFIKFLVYQWDPLHLQGSQVVYIFVYLMRFVLYLISNHLIIIFVCINQKDTFWYTKKWCTQRIIELTDGNSNWKYKLRTGLFISWSNRWGHILKLHGLRFWYYFVSQEYGDNSFLICYQYLKPKNYDVFRQNMYDNSLTFFNRRHLINARFDLRIQPRRTWPLHL